MPCNFLLGFFPLTSFIFPEGFVVLYVDHCAEPTCSGELFRILGLYRGFNELLHFSSCSNLIMDEHIALVSINKNVVLLKDVLHVSKRVSLAFHVR